MSKKRLKHMDGKHILASDEPQYFLVPKQTEPLYSLQKDIEYNFIWFINIIFVKFDSLFSSLDHFFVLPYNYNIYIYNINLS